MLAGQPVILLKEGTEREEGPSAQREILRAARAVADSLRSTLGPRGLDKMLISSVGDVVITNDGATILKEMEIQHPAGKMLAEVAKAQDQECGDGTKTSVILTGELLKNAEELLDEKIHPTVITQGYQIASEKALEFLDELARPVRITDQVLLHTVAMTSMYSKGVAGHAAFLSTLAVRAVTEVAEDRKGRYFFNKKNIQVLKRSGGDLSDSEVIEGHIVDQPAVRPDMPKTVDGARIALLEAAIEVKKTEFNAEIRITEASQMQSFLREEEQSLRTMVDAIVRAGANVVFCQQGIDDVGAEYLANAGIYAVRRAKKEDLELLARATGGRIVSRSVDITPTDLGSAARVEERKYGDDRVTAVTGCTHAKAVTLLVRAGAQHVADEGERSLIDAISTVGLAIEDGKVVTGAGATAVELSARLRNFAATVGGREQIAALAFASALEAIPATLAANAGMDITDTLIELRRRHHGGDIHAGIDVLGGRIADMSTVVIEPLRVNRQEILGATEAATMLLRIDDIFASRSTAGGPAATPKGAAPAEM